MNGVGSRVKWGRKCGAKFHLECMDIGVTGSPNRDGLHLVLRFFPFFPSLLSLYDYDPCWLEERNIPVSCTWL